MQGPNNNKQFIDVYCEDGKELPIYMVANVVRIVNAARLEFPMTAIVEPYMMKERQNNKLKGGEHFIVDGQWKKDTEHIALY
jgi:hypothetical protein